MKMNAEQHLLRARNQLMRFPGTQFLSGILLLGETRFRDDIPTAATDGYNEYYGPAFVLRMAEEDPRYVTYAVLHENLHKALRHMVTWQHLNKIDATRANMAADYVINIIIDDVDPSHTITLRHENWLFDEQYRGMDTGQIFEKLGQDPPEEGGKPGEPGEGQPSPGKPSPGPLDGHMWEEALTAEQVQEIDGVLRQGSILAGKLGGKSARDFGLIPEPTVDWREQFRDFWSSTVVGRDASSWRKLNRRWLAQDIVMPAPIAEAVGPVLIAIDTSGSINGEILNAFVAEVVSLLEQTTPEKVSLLYWDTEIAGEESYEPGQYAMLASTTKPKGGGGTSVGCVKEWLDRQPAPYDVVVLLSDGYIGDAWPSFGIPTLWAMTTGIVAEHASTIRINMGQI